MKPKYEIRLGDPHFLWFRWHEVWRDGHYVNLFYTYSGAMKYIQRKLSPNPNQVIWSSDETTTT